MLKIYFTFPWLRVNALYYFVCNSRGGGSIICLNFMTHGHILCLLCMVNKSSTSLLLLFVKYLVWSNPYIDFIIIRLVPRMKLICIFHHFTWITVKTVDNPLKIAKLYDTRLVFYWLQLDSKCYKQKNVITLLLNLQFVFVSNFHFLLNALIALRETIRRLFSLWIIYTFTTLKINGLHTIMFVFFKWTFT